jgi:hypothetical protein
MPQTPSEPVKTQSEPPQTQSEPVKTQSEPPQTQSEPVKIRYVRLQRKGLHTPTTGPVANILSTLQEIPEQEAGGIGNVDFQ